MLMAVLKKKIPLYFKDFVKANCQLFVFPHMTFFRNNV